MCNILHTCNHTICRYAAFPEAQRLASPSYAATAEVAMCSYSNCVQGNERIGFFCDLMKKNAYWTEFAAEYVGKGISFASFRADVFKQAQSAFLFAIAIAQIGKRQKRVAAQHFCNIVAGNALCLKSHSQSLFECGLKNKCVGHASHLARARLVFFQPQSVFFAMNWWPGGSKTD